MNRGGNRGHPGQVGFCVLSGTRPQGFENLVINVLMIPALFPPTTTSSIREAVTVATSATRTATTVTTGTAAALVATGTGWTRPKPSTTAGSKGSVFLQASV